jgi:hypothetical protein
MKRGRAASRCGLSDPLNHPLGQGPEVGRRFSAQHRRWVPAIRSRHRPAICLIEFQCWRELGFCKRRYLRTNCPWREGSGAPQTRQINSQFNGLWTSLSFDQVVKRIAVHAVELRGCRPVHDGPTFKLRLDVLFH